jgi:hypothetical protein
MFRCGDYGRPVIAVGMCEVRAKHARTVETYGGRVYLGAILTRVKDSSG